MPKTIALAFGLILCLPAASLLADEAKQQPEFVMELGTVAPAGSPWANQLNDLKRHIEKNTQGRVKVKLRLGRGNERSIARRTASGSLQALAGTTGGMSSVVPQLSVFETPYLFANHEEADRVLDNPDVTEQARKILKKRKLVFALWGENGYRSYFTRKPVRSPADLKGVRMRSQESLAHIETYKAMGAQPVAIDVANTLPSLQTAVVDGFDNTPLAAMATTWYQGLDDGQRELILTQHAYQPALVAYSQKWFDKLPEDIQRVLTELPPEMTKSGRQGVRKMDTVLLKNLQRYGYRIHEPTEAELAAFKQATANTPSVVANKLGAEAKALLKAIQAAKKQ